jgi:ABC-type glycerol-3-phosphate transport system substrate-binding protein
MKKLILLALVAALLLPACSKGAKEAEVVIPDSFEGMTLSIITFTGEWQDQGVVADFEERTGATVDMQIVPLADYEAKIRPLLATGQNVPDIFVGEAAYVRQFVEAGYWTNLSQDPFNADTSGMFPYAAEMGTNKEGNVVALTWQTTPGGWFYRRSLAKEYFGTDDPDEIAKLFADWDSVLETAKVLYDESNGEVKMFPGIGETIFRIFYSARTTPWVNDNNEFAIDPQMLEYMRIGKQIRDAGYDAKLDDWSGGWFEAMNTVPGEAEVFLWGWPTWGLFFVMNGQTNSVGDWAVAAPPDPFFWGGTWAGIYKDSPNKALAWEFINMLTQDEEWMKEYAERATEFMSNEKVMEEVKEGFTSETLAGQNPLQFFYEQTPYIDASAIQGYDYQINGIFAQVLNEFLDDQLTYDEAVKAIGNRVKEALPQVTIK